MGRIVVEQHVTVDGFAAGPHGELDWVDSSVSEPGPMTKQALEELKHADAILLGARTYRMFLSYWPTPAAKNDPLAEPINTLPRHVVSHVMTEAPWGSYEPATVESGDVVNTAMKLRAKYENDIIVWGSLRLAGALMRAGQVSQLRLRVAPIVLGRGTHLWDADLVDQRLHLISATPLPTGQVTLIYNVH
ncbi:dihydrofolate reductase family protein [uncultured Demequina sp.]|uniref:dihydrofolate reductase family protein n=1 Tax=uncultured Demequina sp. TaxID=693499 RepID=UPI0025CE694D|nr:dihydrofolate reductase family protein [uncultured Demequina sp.]